MPGQPARGIDDSDFTAHRRHLLVGDAWKHDRHQRNDRRHHQQARTNPRFVTAAMNSRPATSPIRLTLGFMRVFLPILLQSSWPARARPVVAPRASGHDADEHIFEPEARELDPCRRQATPAVPWRGQGRCRVAA
jgi:hypothetical protein